MVRAKMTVSINKAIQDDGFEVVLYPVTGGSDENQKYYKYTPGGECRLSILNEAAARQFEVGKEYYVTFEQA